MQAGGIPDGHNDASFTGCEVMPYLGKCQLAPAALAVWIVLDDVLGEWQLAGAVTPQAEGAHSELRISGQLARKVAQDAGKATAGIWGITDEEYGYRFHFAGLLPANAARDLVIAA